MGKATISRIVSTDLEYFWAVETSDISNFMTVPVAVAFELPNQAFLVLSVYAIRYKKILHESAF